MTLSQLINHWIFAIALVRCFSAALPSCAEPVAVSIERKVDSSETDRFPDTARPKESPAFAFDAIALTRQSPMAIRSQPDGTLLVDFGRVAFGNIEFTPHEGCDRVLVVRFGEKLNEDGAIDRDPPGTVRYSEVKIEAKSGTRVVAAPLPDERNTQQGDRGGRYGNIAPPAVLTPPEWGVLIPFRWVEIEGAKDDSCIGHLSRRAAFPKDWNDDAASFACSNETLNRAWELCRYSIKATLFSGIYVDGDRERIPYEADAYLNQLSDYYVNGDPAAARRTFSWLMEHPTWPTEWAPHMVFMAHADWMHFGDKDWLARQYEALESKTLIERCDDGGLVRSNQRQIEWNDIVDWPPQERDGYVKSEVNTVVNAFHLAAVTRMSELAEAVGAHSDAVMYAQHAGQAKKTFNKRLFDAEQGLYRDGLKVDHYSQHASFFPLAFDLVDEQHRESITDWLADRGMQCSVYASQYLLEALFENGAGEAAVEMMVAPGDRSWRHMLDSDATITWEAWNVSAKPNLDWNHAWGAAPANLLPRYVLGVQPLSPGWDRTIIRPCLSGLEFARGVTPTQHGPIEIDWRNTENFTMRVQLPEGVSARIHVPNAPNATGVFVNDHPAEAVLEDGYWNLAGELTGSSVIEVR